MSARVVQMPKKKTRYKPTMFRDGSEVLISAERNREIDMETLCELLSPRFIRLIRLLDDEGLAVLELLAAGVFISNEDDLDRISRSIRKRKQRPISRDDREGA